MRLLFHNAFPLLNHHLNNKELLQMAIVHHHNIHLQTLSSSFTTSTLSQNLPPSHVSIHSQNHLKELCRQGNLKEAFISFNTICIQNSPQPLPQEVYSSILELCASQKASSQGQQVHAHIVKSSWLGSDRFLSTKLLFMYGKCGHLSTAQQLFDEMAQRTIFDWNALIGGYVSHGQPYKAIELYNDMWGLGIMPDGSTFSLVLKACGECENLCYGNVIHAMAIKCCFAWTTFVANVLIAMYGKCGQSDDARRIFEWMPNKSDVVSWNSIMSACLQNGYFLEALSLFRQMQQAGIGMNTYTFVAVLQACAELLLLELGMEIHASLLKCGRKLEFHESNALIVMYARCGQMGDAACVFGELNVKDNVSWNSMLSGYVQNELYDEAIVIFVEMLELGFKPDLVSVITISSAVGRLGNLLNGMEIHAHAIKQGFDSNLRLGNTLIDMYSKCGHAHYAERVFHKICDKDFVSWTTAISSYAQNSCYMGAIESFREAQKEHMKVDSMMIGSVLLACSGLASLPLLKQVHCYTIRHGLLDHVIENTIINVYGECGKVDYASDVFQRIDDKDVVSWTTMISCYVHNKFLNEALCVFSDMMVANVVPDSVALVSVLAATAGLSSLTRGQEIHAYLIRRSLMMDGSVSSSLVDMYARCGKLDDSYKVFTRVRDRDLVLWTSMINAYGMHGQGKEAINLFWRMQELDLVPDHIAFLSLLYACSHSGLIHKGKGFLEMMTSKYGLEPWPEHYACIVDLLGRSGQTNEALEFIESMPIGPTAAVWCALLGACRIYSNHTLGILAAQKLLELEPENPGNYVLVANVFASNGQWKDVDIVRARMQERGLRKEPACSWIELGNEVHTFVARDNSHKDSVAIYSKLAEITLRLEREVGYAADTSFVLHDVSEEEKVKMLYGHSERLAIAFGMMSTPDGTPLRITKNLRVCGDCHEFTKLVSKLFEREIIVRDANRFHHYKGGSCSCREFW